MSTLFTHNPTQIIEGAVTFFLGTVSWLFIPDFPDKNTFLTAKQTSVVLRRIENDRGDSVPDPLTFRKVVRHLSDWTSWAYGGKRRPKEHTRFDILLRCHHCHVCMLLITCLSVFSCFHHS
jgi:hypothetical protein